MVIAEYVVSERQVCGLGGCDTDSVVIKSTEESTQQVPGSSDLGKSSRKSVSMEAQLSDPILKLQRYGQIARKNCERILKEFFMGRGLLND